MRSRVLGGKPPVSLRSSRLGTILPLVATCSALLFGFVALAVDLGMIAVAKTQAQNAADAAAMAGARILDGSRPAGTAVGAPITKSDNNYANAGPALIATATANTVLAKPITTSTVTSIIGKYIYSSSLSKFRRYPEETATDDTNYGWSLATATIQHSGPTFFAKVMGPGFSSFTVNARATAVHRPRDVAIIMDYSTSMSNDSQLGLGRWGGTRSQSNNPDPNYPKFGHYSGTPSDGMTEASTYTTMNNEIFYPSNFTASVSGNSNRRPIVYDFYKVAMPPGSEPSAIGSSNLAFASAGNGDSEGFVSGDKPWKRTANTGTSYAQTHNQITSGSSYNFLSNGYGSGFDGYTVGPNFYGKTFFIWPPDPRSSNDWRRKFFLQPHSSNGTWIPLTDNARLFDENGRFRRPKYNYTTSNSSFDYLEGSPREFYRINYAAIFYWLRNTGVNPFPDTVRAGRIVYYTAIPNPSGPNDSTFNNHFWNDIYNDNPTNSSSATVQNEKFWKDYVDFVLGLEQQSNGTWEDLLSTGNQGYGPSDSWGTVKVTPNSGNSPSQYMNFDDNPRRPRLQFWFGPLTWLDFIYNQPMGHNWIPGTAREQPLFACKVGMQGGLEYIRNNHPNDNVGLIFFGSGSDSGSRFTKIRVSLGKDYDRMLGALWYPASRNNTSYSYTASPGSSNGPLWAQGSDNQTPRADGGTDYCRPLMQAYNQFSESTSLLNNNPSSGVDRGISGGLGRRGAQKLIVFLTDGQPNSYTNDNFVPGYNSTTGANTSYYQVRSGTTTDSPGGGGGTFNDSNIRTRIYRITDQITASSTTSSAPGFSTPRKPALIHCLGFGQLFASNTPERQNAFQTFQQIELKGKTQDTDPNTEIPTLAANTIEDYKMITGTDDQVETKLITAITNIMRSGFQLSLIE